eukprot:GHVL01032880.1.p1 GENE.GHVL01032880.1~~GHVL01032880.1.p1  ORF type:complete len:999 (+),score=187.73 GHVL01032880.1:241-2997(+)
MVIPPPNVTGSLHLGHTLTSAIEDSITRWNRMCGKVTLWLPGTDHAGIATQSVVERDLMRTEGKTRHQYGREEFLKRVWDWKQKKGGIIQQQQRKLGVSVDWTREQFTMNEQLTTAVVEAFIRFFDSGIIYRATRLVNWCPHLCTALSEIEVDYKEVSGRTHMPVPGSSETVEVGVLTKFAYKLVEGDDEIVVATTRPETILGDTAVAVHPDDERYKRYIGMFLQHPFIKDRKIQIIADKELVDMEFGTGAVKVTPAHDQNDFKTGRRHGLEEVTVIDENGFMNKNAGEFSGMARFACRKQIIKRLTELNLHRGWEPNPMSIPICSRTGDILEPLLKPQWWVNCANMAKRGIDVVKSGELRLIPEHHVQTWNNWLENIQDWCISRQLWWGHRIPAYLVIEPKQSDEVWVVGRNMEEARDRAAEKLKIEKSLIKLKQDEDVLDTWFSSGIFPMSTMGWPNETADFKNYFPGTLLETGHDILFFWVARMVMMSLALTDQVPFNDVFLHAMIRDAHGKKMSKSLGNVIDPLDVIYGISLEDLHKKIEGGNLAQKEVERAKLSQKQDYPSGIPACGADALRFGLLAYTKQTRAINLDVKRVCGYRQFCNKLWNATRFALMNFPDKFTATGITSDMKLDFTDNWILSRLSYCSKSVNENMKLYQLSDCVSATYYFWLNELCDVYLETLKPRMSSEDTADINCGLQVLYICLDQGLRLLHPFIPFVTEELYQRIPTSPSKFESISISTFPQEVISWNNPLVEDKMILLQSTIKTFRSLKETLDIVPKDRPLGYIRHQSKDLSDFLESRFRDIMCLGKLGNISCLNNETPRPSDVVVDVMNDQCHVMIDAKGVNLSAALVKMTKKIEISTKSINNYAKKEKMEDYETKVPEEVRNTNSEKLASLRKEVEGFTNSKKEIEEAIQRQ